MELPNWGSAYQLNTRRRKQFSDTLQAEVFPAHHSLNIKPEIVIRMRDPFLQLKAEGLLHRGSGTFWYGDWAVWLYSDV